MLFIFPFIFVIDFLIFFNKLLMYDIIKRERERETYIYIFPISNRKYINVFISYFKVSLSLLTISYLCIVF
jgi:hypothetical protein